MAYFFLDFVQEFREKDILKIEEDDKLFKSVRKTYSDLEKRTAKRKLNNSLIVIESLKG